jgi:glyoxylase-like metal-dependent hydrolase (beta-lactamase superfamily II)
MKHRIRFMKLPPCLIALVVVLGGTDWAHGRLARPFDSPFALPPSPEASAFAEASADRRSLGGVPSAAAALGCLGGGWSAARRSVKREVGSLSKGEWFAQGRPAAENAALETIQIRPNVYVIFGAGSNVAVHVGSEGVILVDSGSVAMADKLLQAVKAITDQPIRFIIDTSADADHVGGNEMVARAGVAINPDSFSGEKRATVLAHENVLLRMSAPSGNESLFPSGAWPTETYTSRTRSMYLNDDAIQVMRQPGAHSDSDSIVLFRRADVIVTGDILDLRHFPMIDPAEGGSIQGELDALNRLLELTVPAMPLVLKEGRTLLVPGHGRISDYGELVEYRDMVTIIRDIIQDMIDKGMTLEQVKGANPTQGYRRRYGADSGPWTTQMFVEAIYNGLRGRTGKP